MNRGQLTSHVEQIANAVNLASITDQLLNVLLSKLYTDYTWGFLIREASLAMASGVASVAIPTDYGMHFHCKWFDRDVTPNSSVNIIWADYSDFVQIEVPLQVADHPERYTVTPNVYRDSTGSRGTLLIHPTFDAPGTVVLYYYIQPADLSLDADVPTFPDHPFLADALVNEIHRYQRDPRWDPYFIERNIKRVRGNMKDQGGVSTPTVRLDPRYFRKHKRRNSRWLD